MAIVYKDSAISPAKPRRAISLDLPRDDKADHYRLALSNQLLMFLSLLVADIVAVEGAFYLGTELYATVLGRESATSGFRSQLALIALTLPMTFYFMDVYRVDGQAAIERFPSRIRATCLWFALLVSLNYAAADFGWPVGPMALSFLIVLVLPQIAESVVRSVLTRLDLWGVPAVVIGAGPTGRRVIGALQAMPELGLRPVGFFENGSVGKGVLPSTIHGVPLLGSIDDSTKYSRSFGTAIVTTPRQTNKTLDAVAAELRYRNVIVVPDLHDLPTLWLHAREFNGLIGLQMRRNLLIRRNRWAKQAIDSLLALPLAIIALPVIAALAIWIRTVSGGSPFYAQMRAGKGGSPINVWKLRTMYSDAELRLEQHLEENPAAREEWSRCFKLSNDPRILPGVGHFLRRTSLDELPQLFNVIRGEMSLVGPRPFPRYHLDKFDQAFQSLRASVVPGMTGLWQISARSDGDLAVQRALDTYYIRNWSIFFDFYILYRTLGAVIAARGAR